MDIVERIAESGPAGARLSRGVWPGLPAFPRPPPMRRWRRSGRVAW